MGPNVFDHTDYRRYLEAWFSWRKSQNRRYSHRSFSRRLGSSDPSLLLNILKGRRKLPKHSVDGFVRVLKLDREEANYFCLLVKLGQAKDEEDRERAWAALSELRARLRKPEVNADRLAYLQRPLFPVVRSLAECSGFVDDPSWIASHVLPPVATSEAQEAMQLLLRLGFLRREGERIVVTEEVVRTGSTVEALGTWDYHERSLRRAQEVLLQVREGAPVQQESAYLGVTVAVPSERLDDLRRLLYEHFGKVLHQCKAWPKPDRVVQLNVQMFPASVSTKT